MTDFRHRGIFVNPISSEPGVEDDIAWQVLALLVNLDMGARERVLTLAIANVMADRGIELKYTPTIKQISEWMARIVSIIPATKLHKVQGLAEASKMEIAAAEGRIHEAPERKQ